MEFKSIQIRQRQLIFENQKTRVSLSIFNLLRHRMNSQGQTFNFQFAETPGSSEKASLGRCRKLKVCFQTRDSDRSPM
jgi:hypothetical protein